MKTVVSRAFLMTAAAAGIVAAVLCTCIFGIEKIDSDAMEPVVADGSKVLVNRIAYFYRKPEIGDVVAFNCNVYSEDGEGSTLIRRVAAVEGDKVKIQNGNLYVNDVLYEGYREQSMYLEDMDETAIGKNRVFVLGDTKTAILDSRDQAIGQLRLDEIEGKVCFK